MYAGGRAYGNAFLDDYAALIGGLLDLHEADDAGGWGGAAEKLTERVLTHFWDEENGGFFFTSDDHEELLARPVNYSDLPLPSGNALMARNLIRLAEVLERPAWRDLAGQTLERFGHGMTHSAQGFSYMLLALEEYLEGEP